jgi:hypothetical protein
MHALRQLSALATAVPVYELCMDRDWSRLDELVAQVFAWHPGTMPSHESASLAKARA